MHWLYASLSKELQTHADEEIKHAKKINKHINFLGGIPAVGVAQVLTASDNGAMLRQDLAGEEEAIRQYKKRIYQARQAGDYGTEAMLLGILADEEHHANDLKTILEG